VTLVAYSALFHGDASAALDSLAQAARMFFDEFPAAAAGADGAQLSLQCCQWLMQALTHLDEWSAKQVAHSVRGSAVSAASSPRKVGELSLSLLTRLTSVVFAGLISSRSDSAARTAFSGVHSFLLMNRFKYSVSLHLLSEAHGMLREISDDSVRIECVERLVIELCAARQTALLLQCSWSGLQKHVQEVLWWKARAAPVTDDAAAALPHAAARAHSTAAAAATAAAASGPPNYYEILAAFCLKCGDWLSAARYVYHESLRLELEARAVTQQTLQRLAAALRFVSDCLTMNKESSAARRAAPADEEQRMQLAEPARAISTVPGQDFIVFMQDDADSADASAAASADAAGERPTKLVVVTKKHIERRWMLCQAHLELLRARALLRGSSAGDDPAALVAGDASPVAALLNSDPYDLLSALLAAHRFQRAMELAACFELDRRAIFEALTAQLLALDAALQAVDQRALAAAAANGALIDALLATLDDQKSAMDAAPAAAAHSSSLIGAPHAWAPYAGDSGAADDEACTADLHAQRASDAVSAGWRLLHGWIAAHDSAANAFSYRLAVAEVFVARAMKLPRHISALFSRRSTGIHLTK
jgi:hypothetical protein